MSLEITKHRLRWLGLVLSMPKELGLTWFEAQAKARDRLEWRNLIAALCPNRGEKVE